MRSPYRKVNFEVDFKRRSRPILYMPVVIVKAAFAQYDQRESERERERERERETEMRVARGNLREYPGTLENW